MDRERVLEPITLADVEREVERIRACNARLREAHLKALIRAGDALPCPAVRHSTSEELSS